MAQEVESSRAWRLALLTMTSPSFESICLFGTVDLSTTMSDDVRDAGQLLLVLLKFIGRLGPAPGLGAGHTRARPPP